MSLQGEKKTELRVKVLHYKPGFAYGNIMFLGGRCWPMRGWKFPKEHPFSDNPEPTTFTHTPPMGDDDLSRFRQAGYYASCFPEGDGISFQPLAGQDEAQIELDIMKHLKVTINKVVPV